MTRIKDLQPYLDNVRASIHDNLVWALKYDPDYPKEGYLDAIEAYVEKMRDPEQPRVKKNVTRHGAGRRK